MKFLPTDAFNDPRFIGLWTYRPYGGSRHFCASVMVNGIVQETEMYDTWIEALTGAAHILDKT